MTRHVLVIDDDETDVMFLTQAFVSTGLPVIVHHAVCGEDGLDYMRTNLPDLVLLDLKMPGTSGFEVLSSIKVDEALKRIPVIVFSSSQNRQDVRCSYENAANAYIMKPSSMSGYLKMVNSLSHFWLDKVITAV